MAGMMLLPKAQRKKFIRLSLAFTFIVWCFILSVSFYHVFNYALDARSEEAEPIIIASFPLKQVWRLQLNGRIDHPLAVWENKVFVRTENSLYALSGMDGSIIWQQDQMAWIPQEVILVQDEWIVTRQNRETLLILEADTGTVRASIPDAYLERNIEGGVLDEQSLYVILRRGLHAYDLTTGTERWGKDVGSDVDIFINPHTGELYLVTPESLDILDKTTGDRQQHLRFVNGQERFISPNPNLYVVSRNELILARKDQVYVFDLFSQTIRLTINSGKLQFSPRLVNKQLYLTNESGEVLEADIVSGETLWRYQISEASKLLQTPNLLGNYLYTKDQRTGPSSDN